MTTVMTHRERVQALLRRELPDHMGLYEHLWPETLELWEAQGYPKGVPIEEHFGFDIQPNWGGIDSMPLRGQQQIIEETDEHQLIKHGNGATMRYWKHKSGTPEHVAFDCDSPAKWESIYKPHLLALDPERCAVQAMQDNLAQARRHDRYSVYAGVFIFELLRSTLGDVVMLESLALEPEWMHDFCRTYTDWYLRHLDYLFEHAGQPDGAFIYEDLGYSKGLFCSPGMLEELIMPYYRELFAYFHNRGMQVILHSCGNITAAVPLVIAAGIDCLQPMEAKAGVDVVSLARQYGDRIAFMGNIDVRVLESGNRDAIEQEVGGKITALKDLGAAYFLHSDHSISSNVRLASYQFMLELYRTHGHYR